MMWHVSYRASRSAAALADRHYNRQQIGSPQFVPPGRCLVLVTPAVDAVWVTSWPLAEYTHHAWPGAWVNSLFRREPHSPYLASDLIRAAVAATRWYWPDVPELGLVTFVDASKVRHKRDPGRCYLRAGFSYVRDGQGRQVLTKGGLVVLRMMPGEMPDAALPDGAQLRLEGTA